MKTIKPLASGSLLTSPCSFAIQFQFSRTWHLDPARAALDGGYPLRINTVWSIAPSLLFRLAASRFSEREAKGILRTKCSPCEEAAAILWSSHEFACGSPRNVRSGRRVLKSLHCREVSRHLFLPFFWPGPPPRPSTATMLRV